MRLINAEVERLPDGRLAFFRKYFRLIMRD